MLTAIIIIIVVAALASRIWRFIRNHIFLIILILLCTGALGGLKLYHDGVLDFSTLLSKAGIRNAGNMQVSIDRDIFDRLDVAEDARIRVYVKDILEDGDLTRLIVDLPEIGERTIEAAKGSRAFEKGREYYLILQDEIAPAVGGSITAVMAAIQQGTEEFAQDILSAE